MDDTNLTTLPTAETTTAVPVTPQPQPQTYHAQDIEAWVAAFSDCV